MMIQSFVLQQITQAGNSSGSAFIAAQNNDVTTKKYVDDKIEAGGSDLLGGVYITIRNNII